MNDNLQIYKNLEFIFEGEPDYYVIISFAMSTDHFISEKSIIFQMEPYIYDLNKNWGVHAWPPEWSHPDPSKFFHIRKHTDYLNPAQWMFPIPKEVNMQRKNKFIAIISEKLIDDGHINRVEFIRYIENKGHNFIDVYGTANHHNFKNYIGTLENKSIQSDYKYIFSVENNREYNYATEKIWESFISCSLCFYDGCPNLSKYINDNAYIAIDCSKKEEVLNLMLNAIETDLWSQRLPFIVNAKQITIDKYNILEIISDIVS